MQHGRKFALTVLVGPDVVQDHSLRGVTQPGHEVPCRRPVASHPRGTGVSEVVEVEVGPLTSSPSVAQWPRCPSQARETARMGRIRRPWDAGYQASRGLRHRGNRQADRWPGRSTRPEPCASAGGDWKSQSVTGTRLHVRVGAEPIALTTMVQTKYGPQPWWVIFAIVVVVRAWGTWRLLRSRRDRDES